ncbi:MAG: hypothetical protein ACRC57_06440 [Sarcina sp.]
MKEVYFYEDLTVVLKKRIILIILAFVVGCLGALIITKNYLVVESTIHLRKNQHMDVAEYRNYSINFNDIARSLHNIIKQGDIISFTKNENRENINKKIKILSNENTGNITLYYKINNKETDKSQEILGNITSKIVTYFNYGESSGPVSYTMEGIKTVQMPIIMKIISSLIGGIFAVFAMIIFILFLEIVF